MAKMTQGKNNTVYSNSEKKSVALTKLIVIWKDVCWRKNYILYCGYMTKSNQTHSTSVVLKCKITDWYNSSIGLGSAYN